VIITDTNLSGVTGIAISDTAATLDANRSYASRQKQRALAWSGAKKTQATAKRRRLPFLRCATLHPLPSDDIRNAQLKF
jgi:hypothetical protein